MLIKNNTINFTQQSKQMQKPDNINAVISTQKTNFDSLPAAAWQANMLPFGSVKLSVNDFRDKMQAKLDSIRNGTFERTTIPKEETYKLKENAIKNISGPLVLECAGLEKDVLTALNKEFAKITSTLDLYKLINDPRIPDNTPITVTEPYTENYSKFMAEVTRGNATNDVEQATNIVEKASKEMQGKNIELPELEIKVNRKALLTNIIDHINAGLKYEPLELVSSPYMSFISGDEVDIKLIKPVYER